MGIHYLPWDLGTCTMNCTTPSTTKGEVLHDIPKQDPKPQGKPHAACGSSLPCSAISDSRRIVPILQGTADRHFSHATLKRAYKPKFVSGQIHRNGEAWHDFTNPQSLMSELLFTPSPKLHRELSAATAPLPIPGMLSRCLLPCSLSQLRVTQLSSQEENHPCRPHT